MLLLLCINLYVYRILIIYTLSHYIISLYIMQHLRVGAELREAGRLAPAGLRPERDKWGQHEFGQCKLYVDRDTCWYSR